MLILLLIIIILSHSAVRNDVLIYIIDSSLLSKILSISDDELVFQYTSTKVTNFCRFLRWDSVWRKDTEVWSCITGKVWGGPCFYVICLQTPAHGACRFRFCTSNQDAKRLYERIGFLEIQRLDKWPARTETGMGSSCSSRNQIIRTTLPAHHLVSQFCVDLRYC